MLIVVLQQSIILAILAFLPATFASLVLYSLLSGITNIAIVMTSSMVIKVGLLMLTVCSISAIIATRKLREADPASVFN